jgi:hypothetical protein
MKLWQFGLVCVAVAAMSLMATHGWADEIKSSDISSGKVGCELAKNLYVGTQSLIQGNVGLLLGLIMLLAGFWALINGAAILPSMATIIMGGLVTALPSLINSFFEGIGNVMSGDMGGAPYSGDPQNLPCEAQAITNCSRDDSGGDSRGTYSCTTSYIYNGQIIQ